jgi:hypothetical protein
MVAGNFAVFYRLTAKNALVYPIFMGLERGETPVGVFLKQSG